VRGRSPNQRGENRGRSKSRSRYSNRSLTRDQCAFCKETGHWKKNCPKLKKKNKMMEKLGKLSEVNVVKSHGNESDSSTQKKDKSRSMFTVIIIRTHPTQMSKYVP